MQIKVSADRLKRKYEERRKGIREADSYFFESYCKTRTLANKSRHANQNPN